MQKLYNHSKTNIADVNQKKKLQLLTISRQKGGSKINYIECRGVGGTLQNSDRIQPFHTREGNSVLHLLQDIYEDDKYARISPGAKEGNSA